MPDYRVQLPDRDDTPYEERKCYCGMCDWCYKKSLEKGMWCPDTKKEENE